MSAENEMRAVMTHAADKIAAVQQRQSEHNYNHGYALPADCNMALSYAEGVLRLLATYLKIEVPAPRSNGHQKLGRPRDEYGRYLPKAKDGS